MNSWDKKALLALMGKSKKDANLEPFWEGPKEASGAGPRQPAEKLDFLCCFNDCVYDVML